MTNVKAGDKIKITGCSVSTYWYHDKIGKVYTVAGFSDYFNNGAVELEGDSRGLCVQPQDFEVVKENNGFVVNEQGGMKGDGDKVRPTILLKDLNQSVQSVIRVLEYGAKKYNRANYAKVENERYEDALGRHYMAYLSGEKNDSETGESHLAHVVCCALFMMQKEIESE